MLPRRAFFILGSMFLLIGFVFLFSSFNGFTGYAIVEDVDVSVSSISGIWFILAGAALIAIGSAGEIGVKNSNSKKTNKVQ
jgi:hypothetical protein